MSRQKPRSSLLTRKSKGITKGKEVIGKASSLKPQKTRQLIRRFHILQKNKSSIFGILQEIWQEKVNEDNFLEIISKYSKLNQSYNEEFDDTLKNLNLKETTQLSFDRSSSENELVRLIGKIDAEISKRGGLETYQTASTLGQSRGGDSSKKLIEWLTLMKYKNERELTALEIGCLSSKNQISTSNFFDKITRIDLRSQEPGLILEQDFMKRPLPSLDDDKFDLISCSLVINFVPTVLERGQMLIRIRKFLKSKHSLLFLVLPLPCVANSRYFDNGRLTEIMGSLGFSKLQYYEAKKVAYWLWEWNGETIASRKFDKKEIHSGSKRNNFCIVI